MTDQIHITDEQIEDLSLRAGEHGDLEMVAVCERALWEGDAEARAECRRVLDDALAQHLTAMHNTDGWCVRDEAGGVWWPDDEAEQEIEASEDPARTARRICDEQPMRGKWYD